MYQLLALLTGLTLSIMISINGNLSQQYGVFTASAIIHVVGSVFALLLCVIKKEKKHVWGYTPKWIYLGGAIGVFSTLFNNFSYGHISMTSIVALGLLGQTVTSITIDSLGLFGMKKHPFQKASLIGLIFSFSGIFTMLDHSVTAAVYAVCFSLGAGISVVMSRAVNARLAEKIGPLEGSLVNHLVGLPITVVIAIIAAATASSSISTGDPFRPWIYIGGMFGVTAVLLCNVIVPRVSAFRMTILTFLGQVSTGVLLDLLIGNRHLDASFKGGLIIAAGLVINMIVEQLLKSKNKKPV
jgi:transporter family-2 protein